MIARRPLPTAPSSPFRRKGLLEVAGECFRQVRFPPHAVARLKRVYYSALMLQTLGRGLRSVLPRGEIIRTHPEFRYLSWNPAEYEAFRHAARPGMVALDVGANVGAYSMLLGQWVGDSGAVFAFEPAPIVFDGLLRHIELNHLARIVRPICAAVGAASLDAPLLVAGTHGESRLAAASDGAEATIEVPVTTIDEFCARHQVAPAFIKVDVEGAELDVLRGARDTIRRCRHDLSLFVEMHPSIWPSIGVSRQDILAELAVQSLEAVPLVPTPDIWALEGLCVRLVPRGAGHQDPGEA